MIMRAAYVTRDFARDTGILAKLCDRGLEKHPQVFSDFTAQLLRACYENESGQNVQIIVRSMYFFKYNPSFI